MTPVQINALTSYSHHRATSISAVHTDHCQLEIMNEGVRLRWYGILRGKRHLEDLGVDGKVTLKRILQK